MLGKDSSYRLVIRDILEHSIKDRNWFDLDYISTRPNPWLYIELLNPFRVNLIDFIPISQDDDVLLLGADSDWILNNINRRSKSLVCLEEDFATYRLAKVRAEKATVKCASYESVSDNGKRFDKVFWLSGAEYYKENFQDIIKSIYSCLKNNGKMYFACKNAFSIRHMSGISSDGRALSMMEGAGYPGYSKGYLEKTFSDVGFGDIMFYYPYPDHMMPFDIYSNDYLPKASSIPEDRNRYVYRYLRLFDDRAAMENVISQHMFAEFSNSYLVEAVMMGESV